jgi:hypothetical protein
MSNYSVLHYRLDESFTKENPLENKDTDIGYSQDEIIATSTEDLLVLRKAIYSYLKCPNLKKRNPNYLKVFKRINEELRKRKAINPQKDFKAKAKTSMFQSTKSEKDLKKQFGSFVVISEKNNKNFVGDSFVEEVKNCRKFSTINTEFIKRKRAFTTNNAVFSSNYSDGLNFPSFLQDKSTIKDDENKSLIKNYENYNNEIDFGVCSDGIDFSKYLVLFLIL